MVMFSQVMLRTVPSTSVEYVFTRHPFCCWHHRHDDDDDDDDANNQTGSCDGSIATAA